MVQLMLLPKLKSSWTHCPQHGSYWSCVSGRVNGSWSSHFKSRFCLPSQLVVLGSKVPVQGPWRSTSKLPFGLHAFPGWVRICIRPQLRNPVPIRLSSSSFGCPSLWRDDRHTIMLIYRSDDVDIPAPHSVRLQQ